METDDPPEVKAAHDLALALRQDGYSVGFDSSDVVDDFDEHSAQAQAMLGADDLITAMIDEALTIDELDDEHDG